MKLRNVYRFRMRPTAAQAEQLHFPAGARRWIWNWALARKRQYYEEHGKGIPTSVLKRELPKLKAAAETGWLKAADSQALQETLRDLDRAFANFFENRGRFPRFKSRKREQPTFRISQRVAVVDGKVCVPKIGSIRASPVATGRGRDQERDLQARCFRPLECVAGQRVHHAGYATDSCRSLCCGRSGSRIERSCRSQ